MSRSRSHTNSLFHCLSGAYALSSPGAPNRLGDVLHRLMYRVVALGGERIQARLLRRMFDLHHREPDRWSYETSSYDRERGRPSRRGDGGGRLTEGARNSSTTLRGFVQRFVRFREYRE